MFSESAELYDLIYSRFKDYSSEAQAIGALLQRIHPKAKQILDVACGTGEHARLLSKRYGYAVDGIDIEPAFLRIAQEKNPGGTFIQADMTDFDLETTYNVVLCLFSSIGYAKTLANVERTLIQFHKHLAANGVAIVEPWFAPEEMQSGRVFMHTVDEENLKICRMSHTDIEGRLSRLRFEYLIGQADGVSHRSEVHELGLFTVDEMRACFAAAGFEVEYDEEGLSGRGLYIGRIAA